MTDDELARRLEKLETDVRTLTEALESVLDWKMTVTPVDEHTPRRGVIVHGQEHTRRILERRT